MTTIIPYRTLLGKVLYRFKFASPKTTHPPPGDGGLQFGLLSYPVHDGKEITRDQNASIDRTPIPYGLRRPSPPQGFVASVGLGLHRFDGSRGARVLCESLSRKYATPDHEGAAEQLAVLFTLLPPDVQPVAAVKSLLSIPVVRRAIWSDAKHPGTVSVDPSSVLGQGPTELLPAEFRPLYDERTKAFYVPGIPRKLDGDSAELLFGSRGPFPISKVWKPSPHNMFMYHVLEWK